MSDELRGVVVCHGALAGALVDAAEQISGVTRRAGAGLATPAATGARSRSGSPRRSATGPAVVFVDLPSGSCLFAVLNRLARAAPTSRSSPASTSRCWWISSSTATLPLDEAAARAAIAGGKAIRVP